MTHYLCIVFQDNSMERWKCNNLLAIVEFIRQVKKIKQYTLSSGLMGRKEADYREIV